MNVWRRVGVLVVVVVLLLVGLFYAVMKPSYDEAMRDYERLIADGGVSQDAGVR